MSDKLQFVDAWRKRLAKVNDKLKFVDVAREIAGLNLEPKLEGH